MKLFIKLRNKYFTAFLSLILLVMASVGLFNLSGITQGVDASMVKFDNEKSVTITNGSFTSFSSSASYPYTLSSYTTSGNSTPSMKAGAINIGDSEFAKNYEKYGLSELNNPKGTGSDKYVLMINTEEDSDYTYTSSEFTLSANGYYYVTVSAKTIGDNSIASVFLLQDNKIFKDCIIQNISSTGWANYTFFVATNSYESVTLKFGMQIGSQNSRASGCVLFDELHAGQISEETFNNCLNTFSANSYKVASLGGDNAYKAYAFDNKIFDYTSSSTTEGNYFDDVTSGGGAKSIDVANNALNISTTDTYVIYKGEEEVLQPNTTYRFSIQAKLSSITSGSAFVKLDEIIDEDDVYNDFMESAVADLTAKSSTLTISSVTSNKITNGYVEHVIYVHTGALSTSKVQFSFGLGDATTNATGSVSFKQYKIERVPYSAYTSASTSNTIGKFDIAERISLNENEFSNYTFDLMQSDSVDGVAYPASPTSWTKASSGNGYQLSGVVNLSAFDSVMTKYNSQVNTMATPESLTSSLNNNVLMIYNGTNSTQSYTSTSKTLTANKYYKITAFVNTQLWNNDASGATILAKNGDVVLGKASGIKTQGEWQRVEFYINTPANAVDVTLQLALGYGNQTSSGYAFFDNILIEESDTANGFSNRFNSFVVANNGSVTLDLTNPMLSATTNKDYNEAVLFSGENKGETTINAGIVDLTSDLKSVIASSKMEALRNVGGNNTNILAISTALNKDSYYKYTSVLKYNFESSKYYKLSFEVFTDNISQEDKEEKYDNDKLAEGVNISLTGLENATFSYITSNGVWTTYELYVGLSTTATSNLEFSLGSEFTGCYGSAFLGNINLVEVEEAEFNSATAGDTTLKIDTVEQTEEDTTEDESNSNNFSWVYIPTIATFLAIVIAVVGVFVRRNIKFKKRVGNKKVEYDRDITVLQNKYRRLASDARDKEVRELTKECNELIALRSEYEEKYKEALTRLRSARLANRDGSKHHEIMAIEREVKHISKEVARYGVQINNYENEIEFMQTEAYLIDLEKQMMRKDNSMRNQLKKDAELSEEKLQEAIAKREQKEESKEAKAKAKAEKLAKKQAKLQQERDAVQAQLERAKEMDEKFVQEQELKRIRLEEEKVAKEKAKAEKELKKLEEQKAKVEELEPQNEAEEQENEITEMKVENNDEVEPTETAQEQVDEKAETENVATEVEDKNGQND